MAKPTDDTTRPPKHNQNLVLRHQHSSASILSTSGETVYDFVLNEHNGGPELTIVYYTPTGYPKELVYHNSEIVEYDSARGWKPLFLFLDEKEDSFQDPVLAKYAKEALSKLVGLVRGK